MAVEANLDPAYSRRIERPAADADGGTDDRFVHGSVDRTYRAGWRRHDGRLALLPAEHRRDADCADDKKRCRDVRRTAQRVHAKRPAFGQRKTVDRMVMGMLERKRSPL